MDEHVGREYRDDSEALQVRLAIADYFATATASAITLRRPFPHQTAAAERPIDDAPGDWN